MATGTITSEFDRDLPNYRICPKLLLGQKAVVTGSSSGIGRAVAEGLARAGAEVVVNYAHDAAGAAGAAETIENEGGKASSLRPMCRSRRISSRSSSRR